VSRYVGQFEVRGLPMGPLCVDYSPESALDARLGQLARRGSRGQRCHACLDCDRPCDILGRLRRKGWRTTYTRRRGLVTTDLIAAARYPDSEERP